MAASPSREKQPVLGRFGAAGCALMGPIVAGAVIVAHPRVEAVGAFTFVQVAHLDELPVGGPAQLFQVLTEEDGTPAESVDSVFVRRTALRGVEAAQQTSGEPLPVELRGDEVWVRLDHAAEGRSLSRVA